MKPTFITLLALCLCVVGCGKKGAGQLAQTSQPEPTPKGETPRTEPKQESQAIKPGTVLWAFKTRWCVRSSPAIGSDGTVYVGSMDRKLYAINGKSGVKLWEFETGRDVHSSPAIGPDGTLYVGSADKKLYAIKTDSIPGVSVGL